jgi:hypothetical protein
MLEIQNSQLGNSWKFMEKYGFILNIKIKVNLEISFTIVVLKFNWREMKEKWHSQNDL